MGIYINNKVVNKIEKDKGKEATMEELGMELANEKIKNIEKDILIDNLGQEVANLKLQIMGGIA